MENKVKLTDFGLLDEPEVITIRIGNAEVEVRKKIPYEEVFDAIQWTVSIIMDDRPFVSAALRDVVFNFSIVKFFSNIDVDFLEKSEFSMAELYTNYDILDQYKVFDTIKDQIDERQLVFYTDTVRQTLDSIVAYRNSAQGIVDALALNAKENTQSLDDALSVFNDSSKIGEVEHLMDIVSKLGTANGLGEIEKDKVIPLNKE